MLQAWAGQVGTGWTFVPPFKDMTGKSRESINTSIKQEAERRLSARHRQAIKEAAVDAALQQLDPLGLREMTREQVAKEGTEVVEDWRRRLEMGAATPMRWRSASARRCKQRQREQHERQPEAPQSAPRPSTAPLSRQATLSRALAPAGKGQKASGRTTPHSVLSPPFSSAASSRRSSAGPARSPSGRESYQPARANALSAWEAQSRLLVSSAALRSSKTGFIHTQGEGVRLLRAEESSALVFPLVEVETFDYDEADWELY